MFNGKCKAFTSCDVNNLNPILLWNVPVCSLHDLWVGPASDCASGYTQLPIGLFSDDLNFDRVQTNSYKKLIAAVDAEMKKLPRQLEAWLEVEFDVDNHGTPGQEPEDQEPWEPSIGEIVIHNKEGTFGEIIKINQDGTYETKPVSKEEVAARYPGIKVG